MNKKLINTLMTFRQKRMILMMIILITKDQLLSLVFQINHLYLYGKLSSIERIIYEKTIICPTSVKLTLVFEK